MFKQWWNNFSLYIKEFKFSGITRIIVFILSIGGGAYKIYLLGNEENIITPEVIYKTIQESTSIILLAISLNAFAFLAEKGAFRNNVPNKKVGDFLPIVKNSPSFKRTIATASSEVWLTGIAFMGTIQ